MTEQMPQKEVDRIFAEILCNNIVTTSRAVEEPTQEIAVATLQDHYAYLKSRGYDDDEIRGIFDLTLTEGGVDEV